MKVLLFEGRPRDSHKIREELSAKGISVTPVGDLSTCLACLQADRDATVIVDLDLNGGGIESIEEICRDYPDTVVIVLASPDRLIAVEEAMKHGAWDYVVNQPDFSHVEEISQAITRNSDWKKLNSENRYHQEQNRWLAAALQDSPDGIFVADREGRIVFANPALLKPLGYAEEDFIGQPIDKVLFSMETNETSWREILHPFPHKKWKGRIALKKKDGSESAATTKMTQIMDETRETTALIGICLQQEGREEESHGPSRKENVASDEVLTNIADDFKNPLAAMVGYLEMALTISPDQVEPHQILSIRRIEALAGRLYDLISCHSDALKIESGKFEFHKGLSLIYSILERAVKASRGEANIKNIEIVMDSASDLPPLSVDEAHIERAVRILLSTALNLSTPGSKITLSSKVEGNQIAVAVKVTGAPIPQEELPYLFDRRKRLRSGGVEINKVGLFVAHHIVTAHGGKVQAHTDPDGQTALTISLPV
jgi:two-component system sensor histidine kinase ResE